MNVSCCGEHFKTRGMGFFPFAFKVYHFNSDFDCRTRQHFCQQFTLAEDFSLCLKFKLVFSCFKVFHVLMTYLLAIAFFLLYWFLWVLCISSFPPTWVNVFSFPVNSLYFNLYEFVVVFLKLFIGWRLLSFVRLCVYLCFIKATEYKPQLSHLALLKSV